MESIGELIEKLVIANIKLWMVKDAQTAMSCQKDPNLKDLRRHMIELTRTDLLGEKGEYGLDSLKALFQKLETMALGRKRKREKTLLLLKELVRKDIELCEARASLRREINRRLGDRTATETVKKYGARSSL